MLQIYTDGLYTPTPHRVINADPTRSRVSLPFFYESAFEARVAAIPSLLPPGSQPAYQPVKYGSHLLSKVLNNFELHPSGTAAAT
jgi:isopenicillin N synthase-like dioxygenase